VSDDLAAFLRARLDEEEAAAKAAATDTAKYGGRPRWVNAGGLVIDAEFRRSFRRALLAGLS